jgi:hypothetical protein
VDHNKKPIHFGPFQIHSYGAFFKRKDNKMDEATSVTKDSSPPAAVKDELHQKITQLENGIMDVLKEASQQKDVQQLSEYLADIHNFKLIKRTKL